MITKEVNNWIRKIECGNYKKEDIMYELSQISRYLTRDDLIQIKKRIMNFIK